MVARSLRGGRAWLWRLAVLGVTMTAGSCFSPRTPACAFTCISAGNLCPDDYTCGPDGLCHRNGDDDRCGLISPNGAAGAGGAGMGGAGGAGMGGAGGLGGATVD